MDDSYDLDDDIDLDDPLDFYPADEEEATGECGDEGFTKWKGYQVMDQATVVSDMQLSVQRVMEVLGLPDPAYAVALLRVSQWNAERLIESYLEDPDPWLRRSGLLSLPESLSSISGSSPPIHCRVCLESHPMSNTYALGCGHRFCAECWAEFCETLLSRGQSMLSATCMEAGCPAVVHEAAYRRFLKTPSSLSEFERIVARSRVQENPRVKGCPAAGCTFCVRVESTQSRVAVRCRCGFLWCFHCNDAVIGDHTPASCENTQAWLAKAAKESDSVKWMRDNTRMCPKCRYPIEKTGGCMHMVCGCGHEFCWLCRADWKEHGASTGGYYTCNRYSKQDRALDRDMGTNDNDPSELECYMFYLHRYDSHRLALAQLKEKLVALESVRLPGLMELLSLRVSDLAFLREAHVQLLENFRVLQWSYVFGYFLKKDRNRAQENELFVHLQALVEERASVLSGLCDSTPADSVAYASWRSAVINETGVCESNLRNFVQGVQDGLLV